MPPVDERWVLRDIGFAVHPGEAVGIVGRNGAGKSTLLKMIAGIMRQTEGSIIVSGRIAAILELGMGFSGELTGRQNVFHAAGMMGFSHAEIEAALDDIAGFAEIGAFFDQPIRVYSSGMQMRLAFAVATAFRPDILIVDEALAVGDAYFQHKSMERIRAFQAQGTSLILVSHDKVALQSLCTRAILLDGGTLLRDGDPQSVLDYYNALLAKKEGEEIEVETLADGRVRTISGTREAVIESASLLGPDGGPADTVGVGATVTLLVRARVVREIPSLVLGYAIKDRLGQTFFGINTAFSKQGIVAPPVGATYTFRIAFPMMLGPGTYSIALALSGGESHLDSNYEWRDLALMFDVVNLDKAPFDGKMYMPPAITIER
ncbi:ABC transporter ATP-binding protein [Tianweitania sediminis]|uniref:ABC transporter ATP-binding protein n=2 Tax=Tianweitania sediminis TaxID=1502156 RepID=A0A8J7RQA3_9HYPH|nr:ABC transporter ATP-binding protein [Tianweitania sediminis]MBP0441201.1 ABC transporter ATP-binding protein [Tianweitania sediminis]